MLRSALKNFKSVAVITDVADYALVQQEISENGDSTMKPVKIGRKSFQPNTPMMQQFLKCY